MYLVGFIIRIYHDARSPERQIKYLSPRFIAGLTTRASATFRLLYTPIRHECWVNIFVKKSIMKYIFRGATAPSGPGYPHYRGFTITLRHTTFGRTPLYE